MQSACHAASLNWDPSAIAGQDANNDGIRDDVAEFIESHWQASDMRFWAAEAAKASQAYLTSGGNRFALHRAHAFMERSRRCLTKAHGPQVANSVINRILRIQLDNYERQQRYKEAVDQWVHKVSREDLPHEPDDNWNASCGPSIANTPAKFATLPRPSADGENDDLPPPNFFITRAMPPESDRQGSTSLQSIPLPDAAPGRPAASKQSQIPTPDTGSWTTYSPRPRPQASQAEAQNRLRVRKLERGESAAVSYKPQNRPVPSRAVSIQALGHTSAQQKPAVPQQTPIHRNSRLPAALQELAPFIRDVQQR
ncbi:MAG: hypothetical protein ACPHER_04840 [Nevskiales bacterium]